MMRDKDLPRTTRLVTMLMRLWEWRGGRYPIYRRMTLNPGLGLLVDAWGY